MLSARYVPASILADVPGSIELICISAGWHWQVECRRGSDYVIMADPAYRTQW